MNTYNLKNGKKVVIEKREEETRFVAYEYATMKEVGFVNARIYDNKCWIYIIKVEDNEYLNCGVGQLLLNALEKEMYLKRIFIIEGRYFPQGEGACYTKDFYERNDYGIENENNSQFIFKDLRFSTVICGKENKELCKLVYENAM